MNKLQKVEIYNIWSLWQTNGIVRLYQRTINEGFEGTQCLHIAETQNKSINFVYGDSRWYS